MNLQNIEISEKLVPANYLKLARDAQKYKDTALRELCQKRKLPDRGWTNDQIEAVVQQLSALDSNNFVHNIGLGEREARIACDLVARRHYNFGHGIGRSGNLLEAQPKAAGSTLLVNLTNELVLHLIHEMGIKQCSCCFITPMATGMTLTLCLLTLKKLRPKAQYVLWSRIDQKSCFKCMLAAGLKPIVVEHCFDVEINCFRTNVEAFKQQIESHNLDDILCIFSTTSCFAPRDCDDIVGLAQVAKQYGLPHLINNAYGLQSTFITHQIAQAQRVGRVDMFVQSTDKNLLVPVGGAIVAGFDKTLVESVAKMYPGRASSAQILDVFMTLLSLGRNGYLQLVKERKKNYAYLREKLIKFAEIMSEEVLNSKANPISMALTLRTFKNLPRKTVTEFGSMLYTRGVSGVRVVAFGDDKIIDGYEFKNWGAHHSDTRVSYLTVAASLGIHREEIDNFLPKLLNCWFDFGKKYVTNENCDSP